MAMGARARLRWWVRRVLRCGSGSEYIESEGTGRFEHDDDDDGAAELWEAASVDVTRCIFIVDADPF